MGKSDFTVQSAYLATKEKLPDRFLFVGKLEKESSPGNFFFYLFELNASSSLVTRIKKIILSILEQTLLKKDGAENAFESSLDKINSELNKLAESGQNNWIGNFNAIIGLIRDESIFLTQTGKIAGYLFRKGKISALTENPGLSKPHPLKTFTDVVSGSLTSQDRIVFGNIELYNYFSIDRLRKTVERFNASESILEIYKNLKKSKIVNVNAIVIEMQKISDLENETISELPEVVYLDEANESVFKKLHKKIAPQLNSSYASSKILCHKLAKKSVDHGQVFFNKSKTFVENKLGPKTSELFSKGSTETSKVFGSVKETLKPQLTKIKDDTYKNLKLKTKNYSKNNINDGRPDLLSQFISILANKDKRKYLYIVLILIFLSIGYMKIKANNSGKNDERKTLEILSSYDQANNLYNKAKDDIALGKGDGQSELNQALEIAKKGKELPQTKSKAIELSRQIQASIDTANKIYRVYSDNSAYSLNNPLEKIVLAGSEFIGVDKDGKVYSSNPIDKETRLLASIGKDSGQLVGLSYAESENKVFIRTNKKMFIYDTKSKNISEATLTEGDWENSIAISTFSTNVYLLDNSTGTIWRHTKSDNGFAKGSIYTDPKKINLTGAIDVAIDGNLYVLLKDGTVTKLSRNTKDSAFSLKDIPNSPESSIKDPRKIFTNDQTNYIYILDQKQNRVLRFDKLGQFVGQYILDGSSVNDFVVNDKLKKLWLMSGSNIYEINL